MDVDVITEIASYAEYVNVRTIYEVWVSAKTPVKARRRVDGGTAI
jgi:hypothetical protein